VVVDGAHLGNGFIPVQRNLATDTLNQYIEHVGSGVFAVPPGVRGGGGHWGDTLFTT
jgi:deferrochelatase/peroxidase EfeB